MSPDTADYRDHLEAVRKRAANPAGFWLGDGTGCSVCVPAIGHPTPAFFVEGENVTSPCCGSKWAWNVGDNQQDREDMRWLLAQVDRLSEGLGFYADVDNWKSQRLHTVPEGEPNEGAQVWQSGQAIDGGEHARRVLDGPRSNGSCEGKR